jgi:Protein of unknown function (DUF2889)
VRRTTTHDTARPDGLLGDAVLVARGRDLLTGPDGAVLELGTARLDARILYMKDRRIDSISVDPPAGLDDLVGLRASSGFRKALDEVLPEERATQSLRYQLLDEVPTAILVAGYAIGAGGVRPRMSPEVLESRADICAGWATGATILREAAVIGHSPTVTGPDAPALTEATDPLAWHHFDPLTAHGMRRWRRIDVWPEGGEIAVDCFFRDSHVNEDGLETVLHEYTVTVSVDPASERFLSCRAEVGALPWQECPGAVASASRLSGQPIEGLRSWVRDTFTGTSTCTHLNDTLRSLECLPRLIRGLPGQTLTVT